MKNNFYPRIRELREDKDITQENLAGQLDMKRQQYCRYEQGYRDLPTDVLIKLSEIFGVSTDYILGLTNNPQKPKRLEK